MKLLLAVIAFNFHLIIISQSSGICREFYFSFTDGTGNITTASSNSNTCTLAAPCKDFWGKNLQAVNALSPGDKVYYDAGDTWPEASNQSRIEVFSNGTAANYIKFLPYGSGSPILKGTTDQTSWTLCSSGCSSNTYSKTGFTMTYDKLLTVTQGTDKALGRFAYVTADGLTIRDGFTGTTVSYRTRSMLPPGHFWFDSSTDTLYVRLWGEVDPASTTVGVPMSRATGPAGDGSNGLFAIAPLSAGFPYGGYIWIEGFTITGANGMGLTFSGSGGGHCYIKDVNVIGAGRDGTNVYYGSGTGNGNQTDTTFENVTVSYSAAVGSGGGQGFTTYAPRTLWYQCTAHHNFMAGFDFLQGFPPNPPTTDASFSAIKLSTAYDNGLWGAIRASFDPNIYVDGAHDIVIKDNVTYNAGINPIVDTAGVTTYNQRQSINFGSEHPDVSAAYNIHVINNLVHTNQRFGIQSKNRFSTPSNITGVNVINNTVIAYRGSNGSSAKVSPVLYSNMAATANGLVQKNNLFIARNGLDIDQGVLTGPVLNSNNNLFWEKSASAGSSLFNTNGTVGTSYTFSTWKSLTGKDANSVNADPLLVTDTEGSYDAHLQPSSPAIDAGAESAWTCPSWVYSQWPTYFPECIPGGQPIQGSTLASGAVDDVATSMDIGYHYPAPGVAGPGLLTSVTVDHASALTATNGSVTVSATTANAWPSDGLMKVQFDSDFTFDSGGTTAASCSSGCNGTLSVSYAISSPSVTTVILTRGGGATETAASTPLVIVLTNVRTPEAEQTVSDYTVQTLNSASTLIDVKTGITGDAFAGPVIAPAAPEGTFTMKGSFQATGTYKIETK